MLYPISITIDAYIQASSYSEAKEIVQKIAENASIDTDVIEYVSDFEDVANCTVLDEN